MSVDYTNHLNKIAEAIGDIGSGEPLWKERWFIVFVSVIFGFLLKTVYDYFRYKKHRKDTTEKIVKLIGDEFQKRWKNNIMGSFPLNPSAEPDLKESIGLSNTILSESDFPICNKVYESAFSVNYDLDAITVSSVIHAYISAKDIGDAREALVKFVSDYEDTPAKYRKKRSDIEKLIIDRGAYIKQKIRDIDREADNILGHIKHVYRYRDS